MRKTLLFLLLLSTKLTLGQFYDNFNDGNFSRDPTWVGQTSLFTVNSNKQLQTLQSSNSQTVILTTSHFMALNVMWEFQVQLQFDPSSSNLVRIYLLSDQQDLNTSLNGYFIQIGESGTTDSYDLFRQTGNSITKIIDGPAKIRVNSNYLSTKLRVSRDADGNWELSSMTDNETEFKLDGKAKDLAHVQSKWFGLYCKYTATRSGGFIFDDFVAEPLVKDVSPPQLLSLKGISDTRLELQFSEPLDSTSATDITHYQLLELSQKPVQAQLSPDGYRVTLTFAFAFVSGNLTVLAQAIKDVLGNEMAITTQKSIFYIKPYDAKRGDLVINEMMIDPSPPLGLPAIEYVELWNTSDNYLLLKGWRFSDLTTSYTFANDTLAPQSFVILCPKADMQAFEKYGKVIGLSPWPSLNNNADELTLKNEQGVLIDAVNYSDKWYKDLAKVSGGYSLELIDPLNRCLGVQNWQASVHADGGSPGQTNSVYQMQLNSEPLKLIEVKPIDRSTLSLVFSKPIDSLQALDISLYRINNGIGNPLAVIPKGVLFLEMELKLDKEISLGQDYELTTAGLKDCAGNVIDPQANTLSFFKAREIKEGDILINEVLFNPYPDGVDFVEIYNITDERLDLSTLKIANANSQGMPGVIRNVTSQVEYIPGRSYWLLTSDRSAVERFYKIGDAKKVTMFSLPSFPNEKGSVILMRDSIIIDRFDYRDDMHFPLLRSTKGVSLERVSSSITANAVDNFRSATQFSGFATPGYENSQKEKQGQTKRMWLSKEVFSPDGDDTDEQLAINFQLEKPNYLAKVYVYDERGLLVKKLIDNQTISQQGVVYWDGSNDKGSVCPVGIYRLKFSVFDLQGKTAHFDELCVVATKL